MGQPNTNQNLQAKVDRGALITDMHTALTLATTRWNEVCRIYTAAWDEAFENHAAALREISQIKKEREQALASMVQACLGMAAIFLPVIGGEIALSVAPILSTRTKLLVNTVEKRVQSKWKTFAKNQPVTALALEQAGGFAAGKVKSAAEAIQKDIIDALTPSFPQNIEVPDVKTPVDALVGRNSRIEERMAIWVRNCSAWNVEGGWRKELVPVAHSMFLKQPWIGGAPPVDQTQQKKGVLRNLIELALWLRWARRLDEPYWQKVHDYWGPESYLKRQTMIMPRPEAWAVDALDFRKVLDRMNKIYPGARYLPLKLTVVDPKDGLKRDTIDMWELIQQAKKPTRSRRMLRELMPYGRTGELAGSLLTELEHI